MDKNRKNSNKYHIDLGKILLNPSAYMYIIYMLYIFILKYNNYICIEYI